MKLIQEKYLGDGAYLLSCSECDSALPVCFTITNYSIERQGNMPQQFPIKFCWNCGKQFSEFEIT